MIRRKPRKKREPLAGNRQGVCGTIGRESDSRSYRMYELRKQINRPERAGCVLVPYELQEGMKDRESHRE